MSESFTSDFSVRGRDTVAKVAGRTYRIPDIWLAGFCHANQCDTATAVQWWHFQALMEEQEAETL